MDCLAALESGFLDAHRDTAFWEEYQSHYASIGGPSGTHFAKNLTEYAKGAKIYLKREDLVHTGSHHINNALGQILLARRFRKNKIIADTGSGQHGVATAAICAKFGLDCVIYMAEKDIARQNLNVQRMKLLGASVIPVDGSMSDAANEAIRGFVTEVPTAYYVMGSAIGPHPFPTIVRTFQSIIGEETKDEMLEMTGRLPDAVASVGGGGGAVGMFYPFLNEPSVKLLGVEAGGKSMEPGKHSATLSSGGGGSIGIMNGAKTYILQDEHGQISKTHSIAAGMDYPGVGPEVSAYKESGRAEFIAVTDAQALSAFRLLAETEGIIPSLESAHAVYAAVELAKTMGKSETVVLCVGRGDKDVQQVAEALPDSVPQTG
jgi:tryptophan synthase